MTSAVRTGVWAAAPMAVLATPGRGAEEELWPAQVRPDALVALDAEPYGGEDVPYSGAGVPLAHARALRHAGTPISYSDFAAMCGWAFSLGYTYDNRRAAVMAVCGEPGRDGPYEVFRWLTERLGYEYVGVPVAEAERFVAFVKQHVDAGTPLITDQMDGGLIYGYRERDGVQQVWFGGPVGAGWLAPGDFRGPVWAYVLRRNGEPTERRQLYREALARAITKASPHEWDGVPQGLAGLEAYRRDVADPTKDFANRTEWFCWAAFERLSARLCCAEWLMAAAEVLGSEARRPLETAARHYRRAFEGYERFYAALGSAEATGLSLLERVRRPERIAELVPILDEVIAQERAGIGDMRIALAALEKAK